MVTAAERSELYEHDYENERHQTRQSTVILVHIDSIKFPVYADDLYKAFKHIGSISKIVTYKKNYGEQGFVQFQSHHLAAKAVQEMNGTHILDKKYFMHVTLARRKSDLRVSG